MNRDNELFIWNPATRQVNNIHPPSFPKKERPIAFWEYLSYGFGYDESTDDYKVVSSIYTALDPLQTQMFSSRTCSWKKIEFSEKSFRMISCSYGKFVSGRLHWICSESVRCWEIVSLDLAEEEYEIVARPEHYSIHVVSQPLLKDLGGNLSLICKSATWEINVWVMMKYGDAQSWTKIWKFRDSSDLEEWMPHAMPLWLLKNGDLAVALGPDVLVYNGHDKLRKSRVNILDSRIDSIIYFESLVSPFGDEEHTQ